MKSAKSQGKRRIAARRSGIHGRGVFAVSPIAVGSRLIEYKGVRMTEAESDAMGTESTHTFLFMMDNNEVIDGGRNGTTSRWINHSCAPNCEADEQKGRVFIKALRNIPAGQELFYDYGLVIDAKYTKKLKAEYPCWCGAPNCRGTLLAPKDKDDKKKAKKKSSKKSKKLKNKKH